MGTVGIGLQELRVQAKSPKRKPGVEPVAHNGILIIRHVKRFESAWVQRASGS